MSNWAQLNESNIVINVTVGNNNDPAGDEGYSWLIENIGAHGLKHLIMLLVVNTEIQKQMRLQICQDLEKIMQE